MKNRILTIAMAILILGLAQIATAATADSTTWESKYEGDGMPNTVGWSEVRGASGYTSMLTDGGTDYMHFNNLGQDPTASVRWDKDPSGTVGTAVSLEFRLRIPSFWTTDPGNAALQMYASTSLAGTPNGENYLFFYPNGIDATHTHTAALPQGAFGYYEGLDLTQWHTYRLTNEYNSGTDTIEFNLYLDNVNNPFTWSVSGWNNGWDGFVMGTMAGGAGVWTEWDLDYVRWTNTGAFPAPEPATMALLGMGGLLALLRRRR